MNIILQMLSLCKWVEGYQICEDNKPLIRAGDIIFPSPERRRDEERAGMVHNSYDSNSD